jgi:hypothetical protein
VRTTRVGIELSPTACRIVELEGLPWRRSRGDTRVRSFAVLPPSGPETRARLESLRRQRAAVVVWGGRTEHRQVMVNAGSYESMRAEALAALSAAGAQINGAWADIAFASSADDGKARRPVVVSLASASEMADALRPLRDAGIRLRTITTPAVALGSLARMRLPIPMSDAIEPYVALEEQVTCIALVRNGVLVAARDLPWGFLDEGDAQNQLRARGDITARLAAAIGEFVAAIGGSPGDIGQVCVCGGLPDLRTASTMLMERLDVEVEPLDSLFGIDVAHLPEPADEFRERSAELRLAWAAAADWPPIINLLRARKRQESKAWLARAAVVAGAAAGLSGSWWMVGRGHVWPVQRPATRTATSASSQGRAPVPPPSSPRVTPPAPVAVNPPPAVVVPSPAVGRILSDPLAAGTNESAVRAPAPVTTPSPAVGRILSAPVAGANAATPKATAPAVAPPAVNRAASDPVTAGSRSPAVRSTAPVPTAVRARPASQQEVAQPFDAVLGTILYSPDRKLAIIDSRIVGVGDEVSGARVIEITADGVLLRDAHGQLRGLSLGARRR